MRISNIRSFAQGLLEEAGFYLDGPVCGCFEVILRCEDKEVKKIIFVWGV